MTYLGNPVGPLWFRVMFPGLCLAVTDGLVCVALLARPGGGIPPSADLGLVLLGILAMIFIGAGLAMGRRSGFRWRGWQAEEARRQEAAQQLADRALAPLRAWAENHTPKKPGP